MKIQKISRRHQAIENSRLINKEPTMITRGPTKRKAASITLATSAKASSTQTPRSISRTAKKEVRALEAREMIKWRTTSRMISKTTKRIKNHNKMTRISSAKIVKSPHKKMNTTLSDKAS